MIQQQVVFRVLNFKPMTEPRQTTPDINNAIMTLIAIYNNHKRFTKEKLSQVNDNFVNYVRVKHNFLTCDSHRKVLKQMFVKYSRSSVLFPFDGMIFPDIDPITIKTAKLVPHTKSLDQWPSLPAIWFENGIIIAYRQLKYFEDNPEKIFALPLVIPVTEIDEEDQARMVLAYRFLQGLNVPVDIGRMFDYYDNYDDFITNGVDTYMALDCFLSKELGQGANL